MYRPDWLADVAESRLAPEAADGTSEGDEANGTAEAGGVFPKTAMACPGLIPNEIPSMSNQKTSDTAVRCILDFKVTLLILSVT